MRSDARSSEPDGPAVAASPEPRRAPTSPLGRLLVGPAGRFVAAVALAVAAAGARRALDGFFGPAPRAPFITFYPALMLAASLAGGVAGIVATAVSALLALLWTLPRPGEVMPTDSADWVAVGVFAMMGMAISVVCGKYQRSRERVLRHEADRVSQEGAARLRERAAELDAIISSIADGVLVTDAQGRTVRTNLVARRILGLSEAELEGPVEHRLSLISPVFEDGRRIPPSETATTRAIRGETVTGFVQGFVRRGDTAPRWVSMSAAPIPGPAGEPGGAVVTFTDITDRRELLDALREADRRKDEFLGVLSHELRNPLAPIRNSVYLMKHAAPGAEAARRAQAVIERQVEHLTRLVDDLLDVTRIARGKIALRRERLELGALVRRSVEDHRALLEERGLSCAVEVPAEPAWVDGDPIRLAQVVGNLLSNAAKFTPRGGRVGVALSASGGTAELRVHDTGIGIDPALLPRVFDPFVQADGTLARTQGGLGLGLALVKGLAELHGGSVRAESAGADRGASFLVRLPLSPPAARVETPGTPSGGAAERRRRVLVVDDNGDAAASLAELLEVFGHDADVAFDGQMALELARAHRPDVVLCDIGLPGTDGYQVARALRADAAFRNTLLVAVTGYARPEDQQHAVEAGFDRHLAKPVDPAEIQRLLA